MQIKTQLEDLGASTIARSSDLFLFVVAKSGSICVSTATLLRIMGAR
jgi:hypothetical protein